MKRVMQASAAPVAAPVVLAVAMLSAGAAQAESYSLIVKSRSEVGQVIEMPHGYYTEYFDCYRSLKKLKVGTVIPRGILISAGGKSYSWTILSGRCVRDGRN
jgi:hypothetical protein